MKYAVFLALLSPVLAIDCYVSGLTAPGLVTAQTSLSIKDNNVVCFIGGLTCQPGLDTLCSPAQIESKAVVYTASGLAEGPGSDCKNIVEQLQTRVVTPNNATGKVYGYNCCLTDLCNSVASVVALSPNGTPLNGTAGANTTVVGGSKLPSSASGLITFSGALLSAVLFAAI